MNKFKSNSNNKYLKLCDECGDELYPNVNKKKWGAITVSIGKCPRCKKDRVMLVPLGDWIGKGD